MTTPLIAWLDATAAIRSEWQDAAEAKVLATIEKSRGDKKTTERERNQARNLAASLTLRRLHKLPEFDGVPNPSYDDPEWGHARIAAAAKKTKADNKAAADAEAKAKPELDSLVEWLESQEWSEFALSLASQYRRTGRLSERQVASATSMREKMTAKTEAKKSPAIDPSKATGLDLSDLRSGYYSVPNGETRLKVRVARPTKASKWHGWIFVSDGGEYGVRKNYGKQAPSGLYQGDIGDALKAILADPYEAQLAYGRLTGTCGSCGRKLEDETSVALGIGPVCRAKWDA